MNAKRAFVQAIKDEMARQGVTRRDLASILECSEPNVGQMLDNEQRPGMRLETAEKLAQALGRGIVLLLIPDKEEVSFQISRWEEAARKEGLSLWEWLSLAAEGSWQSARQGSFRVTAQFWVAQGLPTGVANALANARIRTWRQLEASGKKELLALRDLGKTGVRRIEELLAARRTSRGQS